MFKAFSRCFRLNCYPKYLQFFWFYMVFLYAFKNFLADCFRNRVKLLNSEIRNCSFYQFQNYNIKKKLEKYPINYIFKWFSFVWRLMLYYENCILFYNCLVFGFGKKEYNIFLVIYDKKIHDFLYHFYCNILPIAGRYVLKQHSN